SPQFTVDNPLNTSGTMGLSGTSKMGDDENLVRRLFVSPNSTYNVDENPANGHPSQIGCPSTPSLSAMNKKDKPRGIRSGKTKRNIQDYNY
ncbi:ABC transporter permease, partial [Sesbania bispinosa]